ncbi:permease [Selenihalanaerobacter shriftii]|uniref:Predicted permease n=1 Tax=Selenihalanaerobacter shriftii TaxID=142842 RepID=A0A1T4MWX0_9FIRM|nr:permease [Selenihalanaerobacter shriftii]SJZ71297.1 Predicted permease [Selenihalanaerobacter shriftii]
MNWDSLKKYTLSLVFFIFIIISFWVNYSPGQQVYFNFLDFLMTMLKFIPAVFILIGLFDVWVDREVIEEHLGEKSGALSFLWAILLSGTTVGGVYVAFPVAHALAKKGASLKVIFTYIGAAAVCRIPMTLFEASFLGIKFSLIRLLTSIPLIILSSILLEKYLNRNDYKLTNNLSN